MFRFGLVRLTKITMLHSLSTIPAADFHSLGNAFENHLLDDNGINIDAIISSIYQSIW
jgi:hypothetical protein